MDLVVLGLGYVGLPLAREAALAGLKVAGFDPNRGVVDGLNSGVSHVDDLSDAHVTEMLNAGFQATDDISSLLGTKVAVICVPTPLSSAGGPDLSAVMAASRSVGSILQPGMTVVLESTTYPGTTDGPVRELLEESGLKAGVDFHLAFSPERIDPGNTKYGMKNTPKVVGGIDSASTEKAAEFYEQFVDTVVKGSGAREAETAKLLENTYRHVNIALVNEMARFCHELGIDLWNVIDLAKTKPFGFQAFYPGPGVGGHCIPIDPNYLSHRVKEELGYPFRFVELAQEVNVMMPHYVAQRAQDLLNDQGIAINGATVLLLGVTYKPNIADQRESPAVPLALSLERKGARVSFHDPHVSQWNLTDGDSLTRVDDLATAVNDADLVVLVQNHREYDIETLAESASLFLDTRGKTDPGSTAHRL